MVSSQKLLSWQHAIDIFLLWTQKSNGHKIIYLHVSFWREMSKDQQGI